MGKIIKNDKYIKVFEVVFLLLVFLKLKERVLFFKKVEIVKDFLNNLYFKLLKEV